MNLAQEHQEYEKALFFLVENLHRSGRNPKPVGIHSVLIATRLYRQGYSRRVVMAALLHDVVEDTAATIKEVREKFGDEVADLVEVKTYPEDQLNVLSKEFFIKKTQELIEFGTEAVALDAADFIENSPFFRFGDSPELLRFLKWKYEQFMKMAQPILLNTELWNDLKFHYEKYVKDLI